MKKLIALMFVIALAGCDASQRTAEYSADQIVRGHCEPTGQYLDTEIPGASIAMPSRTERFYIYNCDDGTRRMSKAKIEGTANE